MGAKPRIGHQRFFVLALITLVLALSTGDRATLSVAGPGMAREIGLNHADLGWLFSAFSWSYFLAQVPSGFLVDRVGAKYSILAGLAGWSLATVLMSGVGYVAFPVVALFALRFLLGLLEAPVAPASARVIAAWFPSDERGIAGAIFNSAQYVSLALFTPLMGWLAHAFGWAHIFSVMGVIGLVLALVWAAIYYAPLNHPRVRQTELDYIRAGGALLELGGAPSAVPPPPPGTTVSVGALLRSRMLQGVFLGQYCIASISTFFISWFPTYLVEARHFSILQAGFVASLPAICGCIGGVSTGFVSDWILRRTGSLSLARKLPITAGLVLTACIILCNFTASNVLVVTLMSIAFFGKGFGSLGWTVVADTAPREAIGLTGGIFNACGSVGGIIMPVAIGYILQTSFSFAGALVFVGLHGLLAILAYWFIVGKIERFEFRNDGSQLILGRAKSAG